MVTPIPFLHALQLCSATLPVGAYSYSEGIEALVHQGAIAQAKDLQIWLTQELVRGMVRLDAAVMVRVYRAAQQDQPGAIAHWNQWLSAVRDTEELRQQSWQMGQSLLNLLQALHLSPQGGPESEPWGAWFRNWQGPCNFGTAFGLGAIAWGLSEEVATLGYLHSWVTNLVTAGVKLIPLGQTAGQQLLLDLVPSLLQAQVEVLAMEDGDLSGWGYGLALASMAHEVQYSRLFRS